MKKVFITIIVIIFLSSQAIIGANTVNKHTENNNRALEWTIMVYLNGDNALSAAQGVILEEISQNIRDIDKRISKLEKNTK